MITLKKLEKSHLMNWQPFVIPTQINIKWGIATQEVYSTLLFAINLSVFPYFVALNAIKRIFFKSIF
jgi:hypothetical protein